MASTLDGSALLQAGGSTDPFDAVLELDERLVAAGYAAGVSHGQEVGTEAGHELGYQKGLELGRELGEYRGRVATLRNFFAQHPELETDRMRSTLAQLAESLSTIALDDPLDQRCFDDLEGARAKMRMVNIWMRSAPFTPAGADTACGAGRREGSRRTPREPDLSF